MSFPKSFLDPDQRFRFLDLWWSVTMASVSIDDGKRLSSVSRAASVRPGVVSCRHLRCFSAIRRRRFRRFLLSASSLVSSSSSSPSEASGVASLVGLPSSFRRRPLSPLEDGQHDGVRIREKRRWLSLPLLLLAREVLLLALSHFASASSPSSSRRRSASARMRRHASCRAQIGISLQRSSTPSAIVGAVRTSSSRRQRRHIFLDSSRGATL